MDKTNTQEEMSLKAQDKKEKTKKKAVGELFGLQLSAPENMKNPMRIFLLLVLGNFLLLFFIGRALGLF